MLVYRYIAAVALIIGVIFFAQNSSLEDVGEMARIEHSVAGQDWISAAGPHVKRLDRKKILAAVQKGESQKRNSQNENSAPAPGERSQSEIFAEAGRELTFEQAVKSFRSARNLWAVDQTLSPEGREERLSKLASALFGDESEIPEESDEDRKEQERLSELFVNFNVDLAAINQETDIPQAERQSRIESLVRETLQATGS